MPPERHTRAPSQKPSTRTAALCCHRACRTLGSHAWPCGTRTWQHNTCLLTHRTTRAIMDTKRGTHSQSVRQIEPPKIRNPMLPAGCTKRKAESHTTQADIGKLLGVQGSVQAISILPGWRLACRRASAPTVPILSCSTGTRPAAASCSDQD